MAEDMVGTRIEETAVRGIGQRRASGRRIGGSGVIAAALIALFLCGIAKYELRTLHPTQPAIPQIVSSTRMRFLENNTTNLPNAVAAEVRPVVTSEEQKFLDLNTIWLPGVVDAA